jgi:hypothetical protein
MLDDEGGLIIPVTKKQGVVVLVLVALVFVTQAMVVRRDGPEKARQPIIDYLKAEYARKAMPGIETSMAGNDVPEVNRQVGDMLSTMKGIELTAISARGVGQEIYVRAEIRVNGEEPPDGRSVRYFEVYRSTMSPWQCVRNAMAFEYYIALF